MCKIFLSLYKLNLYMNYLSNSDFHDQVPNFFSGVLVCFKIHKILSVRIILVPIATNGLVQQTSLMSVPMLYD